MVRFLVRFDAGGSLRTSISRSLPGADPGGGFEGLQPPLLEKLPRY